LQNTISTKVNVCTAQQILIIFVINYISTAQSVHELCELSPWPHKTSVCAVS